MVSATGTYDKYAEKLFSGNDNRHRNKSTWFERGRSGINGIIDIPNPKGRNLYESVRSHPYFGDWNIGSDRN
jgi:hypothetical protein